MRIRLKFRLDDQVVYGCFSSVQRIGSTNSSAVLYIPQELTEEEKSQARENIGVQDPNLLVVTVDANNKATHTAAEINTFVQSGGSAVLVWFSNVFHAKIITASKCQFGTMFNATTGATEWIMDVDASGTATFSSVVLDSLKNPNAITFTGAVKATYDGSKPVEVEIPEEDPVTDTSQLSLLIETDMLPAVHDADGKILTDENGKIILRY